ncbi:hypothetical protein EV356DRAFT_535326 [Viridothelium virens]|uniref:Uncharacterized protein n=1 Tax=Viridothelium virens TaxID=1048519 RepID=A0A6A6H192_VIRVR|nr:hypothetical protein EV356DRAFT_535326 [Viridothelium virens]
MPRWEVNNDDAYYIITSAHSDGLRLGELVATLAECQERQDCGIDKRDTPSYLAAFLRPLHETMWGSEIEYDNLKKALGLVETDADTKVVYWEGWFGESPAFSLKRKVEMANGDLCTPAGAISFRLTKQDYDLDFLHFMRWSDCEPKLELDIYRHQLID